MCQVVKKYPFRHHVIWNFCKMHTLLHMSVYLEGHSEKNYPFRHIFYMFVDSHTLIEWTESALKKVPIYSLVWTHMVTLAPPPPPPPRPTLLLIIALKRILVKYDTLKYLNLQWIHVRFGSCQRRWWKMTSSWRCLVHYCCTEHAFSNSNIVVPVWRKTHCVAFDLRLYSAYMYQWHEAVIKMC